MKRLALFILLLSTISIISAASCTQSGYRWCEENSASYGDLYVTSKLYFNINDDNGDMWSHYPYAVGELYVDFKTFGSADGAYSITNDGYMFLDSSSWDAIWSKFQSSCGESGCSASGYEYKGNGKIHLADVGEEFKRCPQFVSISHANSYDYWAWSSSGRGWVGNCLDIKVVECLNDNDCGSNQECDKSGSWDDWGCKDIVYEPTCVELDNGKDYFTKGWIQLNIPEIGYVDTKTYDYCIDDGTLAEYNCEGSSANLESYECEFGCDDGECIYIEKECESNEDGCDDLNYWVCEEWKQVNKGKITGKCGVVCLKDDECESNQICDLGNNMCVTDTTSYILYISIGVIVIFIITIVLIILKKKRK